MPQYGQPPEEKLAYRSLLESALQQRGFGNQSAIAVKERPPKRHSHNVRICDGNSESRNAHVLANANPADSSKDDVTSPSCFL